MVAAVSTMAASAAYSGAVVAIAAFLLLLESAACTPIAHRHWGVNVHFTSAPPAVMDRLSAAFRIARMDFTWAGVEPTTRGVYDFRAYDAWVDDCSYHGGNDSRHAHAGR